MPVPEPMSAECRAKIVDAADKAAGFIFDGEEPSAATAKAAAAVGVPAGHLRLLVCAVNTGQAETGRHVGDGHLDKSASVPLADLAEVTRLAYPTEKAATVVMSDEYKEPPHWYPKTKVTPPTVQPLPTTVPRPFGSNDRVVERAHGAVATAERKAAEARITAHEAEHELGQAVGKVADYFAGQDRLPFPLVRENVGVLLGETGEAVLDLVAHRRPDLTKEAVTIANRASPLGPVYKLVSDCLPFAKRAAVAIDEAEELTAVAHDAALVLRASTMQPIKFAGVLENVMGSDPALALSGGLTAPFAEHGNRVERYGRGALLGTGAIAGGTLGAAGGEALGGDEKSQLIRTIMGALGGTALGYAGTKAVIGKPTYDHHEGHKHAGVLESLGGFAAGRVTSGDDPVGSVAGKLQDPGHLAQVRAAQTQALLTDLMAHDEVISQHPPQQVVEQYNALSQLGPRSAQVPDVVRAALRKRLVGGEHAVDPHDVNLTLQIENSLKDRNKPQPKPDNDVFAGAGAA